MRLELQTKNGLQLFADFSLPLFLARFSEHLVKMLIKRFFCWILVFLKHKELLVKFTVRIR
jgi:hypothetical protein